MSIEFPPMICTSTGSDFLGFLRCERILLGNVRFYRLRQSGTPAPPEDKAAVPYRFPDRGR